MPKEIMHKDEVYLSVSVAAEILGVAPVTLRRWADPKYQKAKGFELRVVRDPLNSRRFFHEGDVRKLAKRFK